MPQNIAYEEIKSFDSSMQSAEKKDDPYQKWDYFDEEFAKEGSYRKHN